MFAFNLVSLFCFQFFSYFSVLFLLFDSLLPIVLFCSFSYILLLFYIISLFSVPSAISPCRFHSLSILHSINIIPVIFIPFDFQFSLCIPFTFYSIFIFLSLLHTQNSTLITYSITCFNWVPCQLLQLFLLVTNLYLLELFLSLTYFNLLQLPSATPPYNLLSLTSPHFTCSSLSLTLA